MELHSARIGLTVLAALIVLLAASISPAPGQGDAAKAPARTVLGVATTPAGKPLARVTLYLFALPPGQTDMMTLGDQTTVVTDDRGRFTWSVPPSLPPLSDYIGVRSIACYALAADQGTERFRLVLRPNQHGSDVDQGTRGLLERATRPCETRWLTGGATPIFSVVVPDTSTVLLAVRGPDGRPLRSRQVQAVPVAEPRAFYGGAVVYTGKTDAGGRIRLRCFPGSQRFQVFVPGLGFCSTGSFDVGPGASVAPLMPPLAPFARISGTVSPALTGQGAFVRLGDFSAENDWYDPRSAVDAGGRWTLEDVLPGQHRVVLEGGRGESEPVQVIVQPGEQASGITVVPRKSPPDIDVSVRFQPDTSPSVRGRITDVGGRPVAGADVYAVYSYSGRGVGGQKVFTARTDGAGEYRIPGQMTAASTGLSVHLVARQPGFGLAVADVQVDGGPLPGGGADIEKDLVLPGSHAALTVRVLRDSTPAPGVLVSLAAPEGSSLIPPEFREADRGEAAQALRALLSPSAQAGPDGTARFADLTPGLWDVTANWPTSPRLIVTGLVPPFNESKGVIVGAGEEASYTLSLIPPPGEVAFHLSGPLGMPPLVPGLVSLTTALDVNYGTLTLTPDGAGNGHGRFIAPGLFQVTARVADGPLDINALVGPYFEGTALVAVSPALSTLNPVPVPARLLGPAGIRVRLQDSHGQPLRGAVTVGDAFNSARYAASADADGVAVFPDMPQGKYTVSARLAGRTERAALGLPDGPLATDAALAAGTAQPLAQTVLVRSGEEASVTLGAQPPGYVRLDLTGPLAGKGYYLEGRLPSDDALIDTRFDPATNEFLLGPLPAGRRTLRLLRYAPAPAGANLIAGEAAVTVRAGQVVHASLAPQSTAGEEALYSSPLAGTVLLSDGRTPAWGARAALFLPGRLQPIRMARADAEGHLTVTDFWRATLRSPDVPPGSPTGPVLVAWMPGASGAVIVPYEPGRNERLVLPPSVSLHGRVTVGGQPVLGLPSSFRVRAAYQGKGVLNQALTVEATAQADGTFTLGGLTPGTYRVQAARDNIWLSATETVTVGTGAVPDATLDIAPPGLPVVLRLEDRRGRPLPGQKVKIVRPDGPLTDEVWPAALTSDSAGMLRVDGLEAGRHLVTIPGRAGEGGGFDVPAWTPGTAPATVWIPL